MAKNINHLQHVKSNVVENGLPKLPQPSVIVEGEIAVNYAKDYETLSIKNSSGEVVTFSSDNYYSEKKLGSWFIGENSGKTVTDVMRDDERIVAAALNDLKEQKLDVSAYTQPDLDGYATEEWVEDRLGSGFTGENSGITVTKVIEDDERAIAAALTDLDERKLDASAFTESVGDFYTKEEVDEKLGADFSGTSYEQSVTEVISEIETVTAAALNDLNDRKLDMSAYTPTDLSNYYDKDEIDEALSGKVSSITINNSTKTPSNGNVNLGTVVSSMTVNGSAVTVTNGAAAITGVAAASDLLKYADNATYDSNDKKIYFKNGNTTLTSMTIDATDFIKDGMVNDVEVDTPTSGSNSGVTCLIVTFNTDAGKEDIEIPLSQIFDSNLYYTKTEIDDVLGSGFTVSAVTSSVTDVIRENELIVASALNDLDSKKLDASAYTPTDLSDYATEEWVNDRLGSGFTDSSVTEVFNDTEEVIAEALADLDSRISGNTTYITQVNAKADTIARSLSGYTPSGYSYSKGEVDVKLADKLDTSAYTPTDLSGYYTKQEIDEDKLGSGFTGDNSGTTVTDAFNVVERVVAAALTDLDDRKLDASAYTETDLSGYYTKQEIDEDRLGEWFTGENSGNTVTSVIREDELAISAALNDLEERKLDASAYTQPDLSAYATKQWIEEDVLGSGFTGDYSGKSITEVIEENELITSAALNDLNERLVDVEENQLTPSSFKTINNESIIGSGNIVIEGGSGGGGDANAISGVSVNGTPASVSNKVANITSVPASIVASSSTRTFVTTTEKSTWNTVTAKTNTTAFTQHTSDTTAHVTSAEKTQWNNAISGVSVNGSAATVSNRVAAINISGLTEYVTITGSAQSSYGSTKTYAEIVAMINEGKNVILVHQVGPMMYDYYHLYWYASSGGNIMFSNDGKSSYFKISNTNAVTNGALANVTSVTVNGNAATVTDGVAAITAVTAETQLSTASTGTGSVVTGLTVNNHEITMQKGNVTLDNVADGTTRKLSNYATTGTVNTLNNTVTAHTANTTAHITAAERTAWNGKQDSISDLASIRTSAATQSDWNATSGVAMIKNKPTIPAAPGTLTTTATTAQATATNEALSGNIALHKVSKTGSYNDLNNKPTIPAAANNATITLQFGNSSSAFTVNASSNLTINLATLIGIPAPTASDNGKILGVVNGALAWITPTTIYTGTDTPNSSQGNDGDIYLQTS